MKLDWAVHIRSFPGSPRGGDAGVILPAEDGALAVLIDATGHGLEAYAVAQIARKTLLQVTTREPSAILEQLHAVLAGGLGAAISVARIGPRELDFAGVGNVSAYVGLHPLLVRGGIVGRRMRKPAVVRVPFGPDVWLLMHTDGVSQPRTIPPGNAKTAARVLVELNGSLHDDAGVILVRWREDVS